MKRGGETSFITILSQKLSICAYLKFETVHQFNTWTMEYYVNFTSIHKETENYVEDENKQLGATDNNHKHTRIHLRVNISLCRVLKLFKMRKSED